jgi:hypothetical protein
MGQMSWSRILLGGLLAGAIINAGEYLIHNVVLQTAWEQARQQFKEPPAGGSAQFAVFTCAGFLVGGLIVWLYAAMRPRFGAGPRTALRAALAVWLPGYAVALLAPWVMNFLPAAVAFPAMAAGLVEVVLAGLVGGWIYQDSAKETARATSG